VRCSECGEQFDVPVAGVELETLDLACDQCGFSRRLTEQEISDVLAAYDAIKEQARGLSDGLAGLFKGLGT
jgi:DNA-directed RNA polymerase subunit RPC12/RpoP